MDKLIEYFHNNLSLVYTTAIIFITCALIIFLIIIIRKHVKQKNRLKDSIDKAIEHLDALPHSEVQDTLFLDPALNEETKKQHEPDLENNDNKQEVFTEEEKSVTEECQDTQNQPKNDSNFTDKNDETINDTITLANKNDETIETLNDAKIEDATEQKQETAIPKQKFRPQRSTPKKTEQPVKYSGKWLIFTEDGKYAAKLIASNGEVLLRTETYTALSGIKSGIETIKNNIAKNNFAISVDKNNNYFFKLYSSSTRLLCISEGYSTKSVCESAIESVKRFSKTAVVEIKKEQD